LNRTVKTLRSAGRTSSGKVRARNEDAFLDCPQHGTWIVADGMGGHSRGDLASKLIVDTIAAMVSLGSLDQRVAEVRHRLVEVNRLLTRSGLQSSTIGSTVVALLIEGPRAVCMWAGDSRCYLWRDRRLYQLSRDHSLRQRLISEQNVCPQQAARHPQAHALTRAVGGDDQLSLDLVELDVLQDDVFVLCSDGFYQAVDHHVLSNALSIKSPRVAVDLLCDHALRGAAVDNLTAIVIRA
jgi:serine/threonine-protein phosphatase Stp1